MGQFRVIYGIDFSGARDAGNKICISKGTYKGKALFIERCFRARELEKSGTALNDCLTALVSLIKSDQIAAFGFDFPFGIPLCLVKEKTWEDFVLAFPKRYGSPEVFRDSCRKADVGHELKRQTDIDAHTPLSPYNLRLYKQTYYGISKVLFPLIQDNLACILPFHEPLAGKPRVLEICPASTLRNLGLNVISYKGCTKRHRNNRIQILKNIQKTDSIRFDNEIVSRIITDKGGDALDSVIAALATLNAIKNQDAIIQDDDGHWKIEGYVYV